MGHLTIRCALNRASTNERIQVICCALIDVNLAERAAMTPVTWLGDTRSHRYSPAKIAPSGEILAIPNVLEMGRKKPSRRSHCAERRLDFPTQLKRLQNLALLAWCRSMNRPSIIERAFQLAKSGQCADLKDIRARLKKEGYESVVAYIQGAALRNQLRGMIAAARKRDA